MAEYLEQDPNNNKHGSSTQITAATTAGVITAVNVPIGNEKSYSLRPRSLVKRTDEEHHQLELEEKQEVITWRRRPKRRPKTKPAPLSKYRRKTANARERSRMREINEAFDSLRRAVMNSAYIGNSTTTSDDYNSSNSNGVGVGANCRGEAEKLTKISTLRLAMKYIAALSATLNSADNNCGVITSIINTNTCLPSTTTTTTTVAAAAATATATVTACLPSLQTAQSITTTPIPTIILPTTTDEPCLPPTPPVSDSPLSPCPADVCCSSFTDLHDFDPFSHAHLDLDEFFFP